MAVTAKQVKELRDLTGAGPLDCKKALEENDGDVEKAAEWLRAKGIAKAQKKIGKGDRTTNEGLVEIYQHYTGRMGVMVEVNCETDFVANTDSFKSFAKDVALHISSMRPEVVTAEELEDGAPTTNKFGESVILLEQKYIKDESKTINDLLQEKVAELGEVIEISRFARFEIGGEEEDEDGDEE